MIELKPLPDISKADMERLTRSKDIETVDRRTQPNREISSRG